VTFSNERSTAEGAVAAAGPGSVASKNRHISTDNVTVRKCKVLAILGQSIF
jgi:hypothetical protein